MSKLSVAVIGAGMGGLATAAALTRVGVNVQVYEQAAGFARIGAGIQIGCNAMKVLREWGLEPFMRRETFYPRSWNNKEYDTGNILFDMVFGPSAEERYGAPYLLGHRGDLHAALASAVPADIINLGHKLVGLTQRADGAVDLAFANGHQIERRCRGCV
jgi:6-hydroxynicotinate 3-monooxygenase